MSIAAPRKSGKSFFIKTMLPQWIRQYDHVIIMCPTIEFNDDYKEFEDQVELISQFDSEDVRNVVDMQRTNMRKVKQREELRANPLIVPQPPKLRCPDLMLILDDCLDSNVMNFRGTVDLIAERGRHIKLSGIAVSQRLSGISRSIRINSDMMVIFNPYSVSEFDQFIEQFVPREERNDFKVRARQVFEKPFTFVMLDNQERQMRKRLKFSNAQQYSKGKFKFLLNE